MAGEPKAPGEGGSPADNPLEASFFDRDSQSPPPSGAAANGALDPGAVGAPPADAGGTPPMAAAEDGPTEAAESPGPDPSILLEGGSWEDLAESYRREAQARTGDPAAARLWHAAGQVFEAWLDKPREAAVCYQAAFKADAGYSPNLRAARRLFTGVGNWAMVAQLLQAEADADPDPHKKAHLLFERAVLLHDRLGKPVDALPVLAEVERLDPEGRAAAVYLAQIAARQGDHAALAGRYQRLAAAAAGAPALQLALLCAAAGLHADRLGQADEARTLYEQARRIDPRHPVPLAALERLHDAAGDAQALVEILEAEAEATEHAGKAAATLRHAAQVARERLGSPETAVALLEMARHLAPDAVAVLQELAPAYEAYERWDDLVGILQDLSGRVIDPHTLGEVWHQLGRLLDERLHRADDAAAAYRQMLQARPGSPDALSALGKLYFRAERWDDLIWTFEQELAGATDPKQQAMRLFKIAEVQELQLERPEAAIETLRRILDVRAGYLPALQSLTRLYEATGRFADLIALHELELAEAGDDVDQQIHLLDQIARLQEERQGDREAALATYQRVLEVRPDHLPAVRQLQRLGRGLERWDEVVRLTERESELVDDQRRVVALLHEVAELLEVRIGDRDAAIEAWRKVLVLQPAYLPALKALGKLYFQKGRWQELVEMYRRELEVTENASHRVNLLLKMGGLYEGQLLDESEAIRTYRAVLDERPDALPALRALQRLHARRGEWDAVVDVLRREAEVVSEPAERARILSRAAEVRVGRSGRPDQAAELYLEALDAQPADAGALDGLARLYARAGAWRELAKIYERTLAAAPPSTRPAVYRSLAHLYLDRLDDAPRAIQCLEAVLAADPADLVSRLALARLHAATGAHGEAAGDVEALAESADPGIAAGLMETAALAREHLQEPPDPATTDWARLLVLAPDNEAAARRTELARRKAGDLASLLALYRAQLEAAGDPGARLAAAMRVGETAALVGDVAAAEAGFRAALEADGDFLPALRSLKSVLMTAGRWDEVQSLLVREGEAARDPARSVGLLYESGVLREQHLGDTEGALESYRKVLARDPVEPRAFEGLCRLLAAAGRHGEIAGAWLDRAGHLPEPAERAAACLAAADLYEQRLQDPARALAAVEAGIEAAPDGAAAVARAADLAYGLEDAPRAARWYQRSLELGGQPGAMVHPRLRLAILFQGPLGDSQRATAFLQDVLATQPDHPEALRRLADLQTSAENWAGAVTSLTRLAQVTPDPAAQVALLLELAGLHADRRQDPQAAMQALEAVRRLDPHNVPAVERLGRLYEQAQAWDKVVETYAAFISLLPEGEKARAYPLLVRTAEIQLRVNQDVPKAMQAYRAALQLRPDELGPRIALADLYAGSGETVLLAIEEHRELLARQPLRLESHHALYRLFESQKAFDKAFCVAAVLHFLGACDQDEAFFFSENRGHAPQDTTGVLDDGDQSMLLDPAARGPLAEVMAIVGDQLGKVYPPDLERYGLGKGDRLSPKDNSPLRRVCDGLLASLGGGTFDLYRAERAASALEVLAGDPAAVVVSSDVVRRHPMKEQRFLFTRLMVQVRTGTALCLALDPPALAATLQGCLDTAAPGTARLAPADADLSKRCAKSMSRKARKALEGVAGRVAGATPEHIEGFVTGVRRSLDRAGLLLSGDIDASLRLVAAEHGYRQPERPAEALAQIPEIGALVRFAVSEEFFRLRQKLSLTIA